MMRRILAFLGLALLLTPSPALALPLNGLPSAGAPAATDTLPVCQKPTGCGTTDPLHSMTLQQLKNFVQGVGTGGGNIIWTSDNATSPAGTLADQITSLAFPFAITGSATAPKATSEPERAMVFNTSGISQTVQSIAYSGTNAGDFSTAVTSCNGTTLANKAGCYIWVNFSPSTTGAETATLTVTFVSGTTLTLPLSGTGQSGSIVSVSGCSLPGTLAANTTYVMGDVTCNQLTFHTGANNSTANSGIQGDCTHPYGDGTVFDGQNAQGEITDGAADAVSNFRWLCVKITRYANHPNCPAVNNATDNYPQFNTFTGWVLASVTLGPSCAVGAVTHGTGPQTWSNVLVTGNPYAGMFPETTGGVTNFNGVEWTNNANFTGTGTCATTGDCSNYKLAGAGAVTDTGSYSHGSANANTSNSNAIWADVYSGAWTVIGDTIINSGGGGIRCETMDTACVIQHNVVIGAGAGGGGQGAIAGDCGHNITADFNYVAGDTSNLLILGQGTDLRGGDCNGSFTFEGSHNILVIPADGGFGNSGWRYGASGQLQGSGTQTSYSSSNNAFYVSSSVTQAFIWNNIATLGTMTLATAQSSGNEAGSTITVGTPSAVPSGCTGDGTYGIGCKGSGM